MGFTDFLQLCFTPSKRGRDAITPEVLFPNVTESIAATPRIDAAGERSPKLPKTGQHTERKSHQPLQPLQTNSAANQKANTAWYIESNFIAPAHPTPWSRPRWHLAAVRGLSTGFGAAGQQNYSFSSRIATPSELSHEAEALKAEAELLERASTLRKRRMHISMEHHLMKEQWQQRQDRLHQGISREEAEKEEWETYRRTIEDLRLWEGSSQHSTSVYMAKLDEMRAAKQEAEDRAQSFDAVLQRARALQQHSQSTIQAASRQEAELKQRLEKLKLRRSQHGHVREDSGQHFSDEAHSVDWEEPKQTAEVEAEEVEKADVMNLISTDEEEEEEEAGKEAPSSDDEEEGEQDVVRDLFEYLSDVDTGLARLPQQSGAIYQVVMNGGSDEEVLARHPESHDTLQRKDMRRLMPGVWLSDEVINVYMKLLQQRTQRLQELNDADNGNSGIRFPKCHFFSSFFLQQAIHEQ
mmetsp:Transcript_39410/g.111666  ORF Transcript_39410/g.111666 Transcript_39410/m.111666 type:complete len:467 (+) Transcript_39410:328-1728(+)